MTDTSRPSESYSVTEVRMLRHTHTWVVRGFSQCECRYLETVPNLPFPETFKNVFRIRLHPQGNKESNKDFCFFQLFCHQQYKYRAKFTVFNAHAEEIPATVYNGTQQLNGYFEYIRREQLLQHILPKDELKLVLSLSIAQESVTRAMNPEALTSTPVVDNSLSVLSANLSENYQHNPKFTDFLIKCKDAVNGRVKEIKCHRFILGSRSPVFRAMLNDYTNEAQKSEVTYVDIDYDVMYELILYLYSGKISQNRNLAMTQDLLKVAERFEVLELKELACAQLKGNVNSTNVCELLLLADMHNAPSLKKECVRHICLSTSEVLKTDGWTSLTNRAPDLVTEVMAALVQNEEDDTPTHFKRARYD